MIFDGINSLNSGGNRHHPCAGLAIFLLPRRRSQSLLSCLGVRQEINNLPLSSRFKYVAGKYTFVYYSKPNARGTFPEIPRDSSALSVGLLVDIIILYPQVHTHGNNRVTFEPLPTLQVTYIIRNLCFINYKTLAILDQKETLRFLDARLDEQVEAIDCSELDIVYEGSRYRAEDTGGNVSRAMASCRFRETVAKL